MRITYDPAKNERNIRERGLSFDEAAEFDFETAETHLELRNGEERYVSIGYLRGRLHLLCYLELKDGIRVISFRKMNQREADFHGKPRTTY